ncbi:MAG TPA: hypothetical protein VJ742_12600 [Nitrososphaera sp.]|nr:hypothetical protein [Nitrososphaera sp.]
MWCLDCIEQYLSTQPEVNLNDALYQEELHLLTVKYKSAEPQRVFHKAVTIKNGRAVCAHHVKA